MRIDGRAADGLRPCAIQPGFVGTAHGSCLISFGGTRVIVTASVEDGVPPFLRGKGRGWLTAEYAMLPASTGRRKARDGVKKDGRGVEISRLVGRALRQAVDLSRLGERTVTIDCDVLEADGGTRTAAITGGFVALCLAVRRLLESGSLKESPIVTQVAAVSCGLLGGEALLDLCYEEDSRAQADANFVLNGDMDIIEVQGNGEGGAFGEDKLLAMLALAKRGAARLMEIQREALGDAAALIGQKQTLVLATSNDGKVRELRAMLGDRYRVVSMREAGFAGDVEETGATFAENAAIKAEAVRDATGYLSLADDSGLEVDALGGAPGVYSARYAGEERDEEKNRLLLQKTMEGVENRAARFVSALALASPFGPTRVFTGTCEGTIADAPRGTGGFGYDSLFVWRDGRTFAELSPQEKDSVSHRARAMEQLQKALGQPGADAP
ncbi:MAG TPA: ribonuclease PH [Candidatus Limnocylindria bacterium]|nr:ribonuclease PH [Candidatus Limnocylindria bacterium]